MPKYLVERLIPRAGELAAQEMKAIAQQIMLVQQELEANIRWMQSVFTADMVCLYIADDESVIREHALRCGLPIQRVLEVSAIIGPRLDSDGASPDRIDALTGD